jgi:hypothetical protein
MEAAHCGSLLAHSCQITGKPSQKFFLRRLRVGIVAVAKCAIIATPQVPLLFVFGAYAPKNKEGGRDNRNPPIFTPARTYKMPP